MKTRVDVATARSFASLLNSSVLRDAIAMPSVWHRLSQSKMFAVNRFRSDYHLYFTCIACWRLDSLEHHHGVCVSVVDAKLVACFCVDPVRVFLQPPRVPNDRDRHLGYSAPQGFAPVVHRSSQKGLDIVAFAARSLATVVREQCSGSRSSMRSMWSGVGLFGWLVHNRKRACIRLLHTSNNEGPPSSREPLNHTMCQRVINPNAAFARIK
jgi:hypothetical protein